MRKYFSLTFDFIKNNKLNMVVIAVICTLVWCAMSVLYGKFLYLYKRYDTLADAGIEDDLYFSAVRIGGGISDIKEAVLSVNGVVKLIEPPQTVNTGYVVGNETLGGSTVMRMTQDIYEKFEIKITTGRGFDYSSPSFECIVIKNGKYDVGGVGGNYGYGQTYVDEEGNTENVHFPIVGIASPQQFYPLMNGGGDKMTAELILGEIDAIIVKENEFTVKVLDAVYPKKHSGSHFSALIELEVGITEEEVSAVIDELGKYGFVDKGSEILKSTEERFMEDMSTYLPIASFFIVFFLTTLICLIVLSIYRYANEYAIWRIVGASKMHAFGITLAAFALIIIISVIAAQFIFSSVTSLTAFSEYLEETIIGTDVILMLYLLAASMLVMIAVISYFSVKTDSLRQLNSKYKE